MSVPPNVFPNSSNFAYNVVVGGHKADKPSDESGTVKVVDPLRHSVQGFPHEQMPFVTTLRAPTQSALEETPFPAEPGTVVAVSWTTGDPTTRAVIGQPNELNNGQAMDGNNILNMGHVAQAMQKMTGKNKPVQKTQEKNDRGAIVREMIEQGGEWSHNLTRGLATHAAWYPMAGQVLDQVKNIDTAIQTFANIPSLSALGSLGGAGMNMSSMFKKLTKKQKKKATKNMDPILLEGLENMLSLITESEAGGTYVSKRVDEATFIANMVELLSQCTNMSDVLVVLQRLRGDSTLWGLDKIPPVVFKSNTAFGELVQTIDHNGNVQASDKSKEIVAAAMQALQGLMGSNQAGAKGKFLFGEAGELMAKSFDRLPPSIRKDIVEKTAQLTESLQHNKVHQLTLGGTPLTLFG